MDGYALCGADLDADGAARLRVIGQTLAGQPFAGQVQRGECVRVMTGAVMPAGTDTVVMQEDCEGSGDLVTVRAGQRRGQDVRRAGEDMARGSVVAQAGVRLLSAHIGVLASLGLSEIRVHRPLRVAFLATGDELRSVGQPLAQGQIYDSNRYTLYAMLERLGITRLDLGVIEDQPDALRKAFTTAAQEADAVITTGGVSVGEADYVRPLLDELGQVQFWKIAMKPGRPFAFGRLRDALFFGLPGNPVAAMVAFYQFVQPALLRMGGETQPPPPITFQVPCQGRLRKQPGRTEYVRAVLEADSRGQLSVGSLGQQGSGILTSMARSNCFVVLAHDAGPVEPGDLVTVQPFSGLV
jgi:molybdopterin molybdotransferase